MESCEDCLGLYDIVVQNQVDFVEDSLLFFEWNKEDDITIVCENFFILYKILYYLEMDKNFQAMKEKMQMFLNKLHFPSLETPISKKLICISTSCCLSYTEQVIKNSSIFLSNTGEFSWMISCNSLKSTLVEILRKDPDIGKYYKRCRHNTGEQYADVLYGDATWVTPEDWKPCSCPLTSLPNQCASGYRGTPVQPGGRCEPTGEICTNPDWALKGACPSIHGRVEEPHTQRLPLAGAVICKSNGVSQVCENGEGYQRKSDIMLMLESYAFEILSTTDYPEFTNTEHFQNYEKEKIIENLHKIFDVPKTLERYFKDLYSFVFKSYENEADIELNTIFIFKLKKKQLVGI